MIVLFPAAAEGYAIFYGSAELLQLYSYNFFISFRIYLYKLVADAKNYFLGNLFFFWSVLQHSLNGKKEKENLLNAVARTARLPRASPPQVASVGVVVLRYI